MTRVIHKLEADLGCRLFIRSKSGMELTAEGNRFFEYVSAGCLQFFRAESHLSDLLKLENGTISISATETALHSWLFESMEAFHQEYPGVHFQILNHSTQDSIQAVRDGKVDFAVVLSSCSTFPTAAPEKITYLPGYPHQRQPFFRTEGPSCLAPGAGRLPLDQPDLRIHQPYLLKYLLCAVRSYLLAGYGAGHHRSDSPGCAPQPRHRIYPRSLRPQRTRRRKHLPGPD